ncbi:hypothetical protein DW980_04535 [Bacteroides stercoris]|nr:hypothetical protein DW980_04535 [Bacteroides stercoris]
MVFNKFLANIRKKIMYRGALHISLSYSIKKGYLSQTANLFVNLKSNTMKNTLQSYSIPGIIQYFFWKSIVW